MSFQNREQAAHLLAQALEPYQNQHPLVLAIPRGGVPMARIIADALHGEMDVVLVHKISAPYQEEFAIASVDEQGRVYLNADAPTVPNDYLEQEKQRQLEIIRTRRAQYTKAHTPPVIQDRIVIVVDDGIATGATMVAALQSLRAQHPLKLVVAVAVAPKDALFKLQEIADEVVCLESPEYFYAVGEFFAQFPQVTDEVVIELLKRHHP